MKLQIAERIRRARTLAITSHLRPDGDSIGSSLALLLMLRGLGKAAELVNADPAPQPLDRLPGYHLLRVGQIAPRPFDLVLLVEGGGAERTGQQGLQDYERALIDHHAAENGAGGLSWVVPAAAAVGELVYELGLELNAGFSRDVAFNLYAAIAADTGSFRHSNTTARSLAIAADLACRGGFAPVEVSELLFCSNPLEKVRMLTRVLATLETGLDGRLATIHFRRDFLQGLSLRDIETEDIIGVARSIDGLEALVFFKEIEAGYYRVSIRSRGRVSALQVARHFQGGGHPQAAGFFFRGSLPAGRRQVTRLVAAQLP